MLAQSASSVIKSRTFFFFVDIRAAIKSFNKFSFVRCCTILKGGGMRWKIAVSCSLLMGQSNFNFLFLLPFFEKKKNVFKYPHIKKSRFLVYPHIFLYEPHLCPYVIGHIHRALKKGEVYGDSAHNKLAHSKASGKFNV